MLPVGMLPIRPISRKEGDRVNSMTDKAYMQIALEEGERAAERGEVPVGAVLIGADGRILCRDGNRSIERVTRLATLRSMCFGRLEKIKQTTG